jgi:hypothetical protein
VHEEPTPCVLVVVAAIRVEYREQLPRVLLVAVSTALSAVAPGA